MAEAVKAETPPVKMSKVNLKNRSKSQRSFVLPNGKTFNIEAGQTAEVELPEEQVKAIRESAKAGGDVEVA